MKARRILVVGAALGGPMAARAARAADPEARIVLLERAERLNPIACAVPQLLGGEPRDAAAAGRALAAHLRREHGVQVRTGQEVEAVDPARRRLRANGKSLGYDALVWAAGAESLLPSVRGLELSGRDPKAPNVARLRTDRDLERIEAVRRAGGRRAAVLGGGYFGVEAADALSRAGFEVQLLERGSQLLPDFPAEDARKAQQALARAGVKVRLRTSLARARLRQGRVSELALAGGKSLPVDLVVIAAGVRPRSGAPAAAGAAVDGAGALIVDRHAATSLPGIFACGTCVAVPHAVSGRPAWSAQAAVADRTARVAGACAAGADLELGDFAGTAIVRAGDTVLARTGLNAAEAEAHAPGAVVEATVEGPARDPLLGDAPMLSLRLRAHRRSGRLLGGELAGAEGVDKRVDVLAAALVGGLDARRLAQLDLAYAPAFAAPSDPLHLAAEALERARS